MWYVCRACVCGARDPGCRLCVASVSFSDVARDRAGVDRSCVGVESGRATPDRVGVRCFNFYIVYMLLLSRHVVTPTFIRWSVSYYNPNSKLS